MSDFLANFNPMQGFQDMIDEQLDEYNLKTVEFLKRLQKTNLQPGEEYIAIMLVPKTIDGEDQMVALMATFDKEHRHVRTITKFELKTMIKGLNLFKAENLMGMSNGEAEDTEFEQVEGEN